MMPHARRRSLVLAVPALFVAFLAEVLPRALSLSTQSRVAFLSSRAIATALLLFAGGAVMSAIDPDRSGWWGLLVGSGPLLHLLLRMATQGPPSLWPLAVVLAAGFGWIPSMAGAILGRALRRRARSGESRS
jgi:hypothetical protein